MPGLGQLLHHGRSEGLVGFQLSLSAESGRPRFAEVDMPSA